MHKFTIKVPVYQFDCVVTIGENIEKTINKHLKKHKMDMLHELEEVNGYATATSNVHKYHIFYAIHSLTPDNICHEISHVVDYVFSDKGIDNETEVRAYLTGFLSGKVFDYVLKRQLLISKWVNYKQNQLLQKDNISSPSLET